MGSNSPKKSLFDSVSQTVTMEQIRKVQLMEERGLPSDIGTPLSLRISPQLVKSTFARNISKDTEEIKIVVHILKKSMPFEEICNALDIHPLHPEKSSRYRFAAAGIVAVSAYQLFTLKGYTEVLSIPCFDARDELRDTSFMPFQIPVFEKCTQFTQAIRKDAQIADDALSNHWIVVSMAVLYKTWPAGTAVVCIENE